MTSLFTKYKVSNYSILITSILAIGLAYFFKWRYDNFKVDFMCGDAKDYYSYLISFFINNDLTKQSDNSWFILKTSQGIINVHPVGISLLLLPFFSVAYAYAFIFNFKLNGESLPFQVSVAFAALFYLIIGVIYLKKLFRINQINDKISALCILLIFFGTNLLHYTLSESGMSHVYSFSLISIFLYHSNKFILSHSNKQLIFSSILLGLILLIRPNNIFVICTLFLWFKNVSACFLFFKSLIKNKFFYISLIITISIVFVQSLIWYTQTNQFFHNTYKADGFYWLSPQVIKMLFGFNSGFFIYTPLCFLFLFGLLYIYKENKFSFFAFLFLLSILFYFFASYSSYTYFDGLGIRVLVDYYSLFAFLGAKLFMHFFDHKLIYNSIISISCVLVFVNLIYCYQENRGILLRTGMNFKKWNFVFLKTNPKYQNCLGGLSDLTPYTNEKVIQVLADSVTFNNSFDYSRLDYGVGVCFDSIGFNSNRIHLKIKFDRKELEVNSSKDALICVSLDDTKNHQIKSYFQFKLNEIPSLFCCEVDQFDYSANMTADFKSNDRLSVFIWNKNKKNFLINNFSLKAYNYNYQLN